MVLIPVPETEIMLMPFPALIVLFPAPETDIVSLPAPVLIFLFPSLLTVMLEPSLPEFIVSFPETASVKDIVLKPSPALIFTFLPKLYAVIVSLSLVVFNEPFLKSELVNSKSGVLFKEISLPFFNLTLTSPDAPVTSDDAKLFRRILDVLLTLINKWLPSALSLAFLI